MSSWRQIASGSRCCRLKFFWTLAVALSSWRRPGHAGGECGRLGGRDDLETTVNVDFLTDQARSEQSRDPEVVPALGCAGVENEWFQVGLFTWESSQTVLSIPLTCS